MDEWDDRSVSSYETDSSYTSGSTLTTDDVSWQILSISFDFTNDIIQIPSHSLTFIYTNTILM